MVSQSSFPTLGVTSTPSPTLGTKVVKPCWWPSNNQWLPQSPVQFRLCADDLTSTRWYARVLAWERPRQMSEFPCQPEKASAELPNRFSLLPFSIGEPLRHTQKHTHTHCIYITQKHTLHSSRHFLLTVCPFLNLRGKCTFMWTRKKKKKNVDSCLQAPSDLTKKEVSSPRKDDQSLWFHKTFTQTLMSRLWSYNS